MRTNSSDIMNNIIRLFTPISISLLEQLSKGDFYIRELAELLHCSPGTVHAAIGKWKKLGFLKEHRYKNSKKYSLNLENSLLKSLRSFLNVLFLWASPSFRKLVKEVDSCGIYGSYREGSNEKYSDIDLWVYSKDEEKDALSIREFGNAISRDLGYEVDILQLSSKSLKKLRTADKELYIRLKLTSLVFGKDIFE